MRASTEHLAVGGRTQIQLYERRRGQWTPAETIAAAATSLVLVGNTLVYSAAGVSVYEIGHGSKARLIQTLEPLPSDTGRYGSEISLKDDLLVVESPGGATGIPAQQRWAGRVQWIRGAHCGGRWTARTDCALHG